MTDAQPKRRGRPRNEDTRLTILAAAYDLCAADDPDAFTMAGIAASAGVSKQTVYRWWPTKGDVLMEALARQSDLQISAADLGSYAEDVHLFLRETYRLLNSPGVVSALRSLMTEAQLNAEFKTRFREGFIDRRRAAFAPVVDRAAARGDLPSDADGELIADVVFGVIWYRMLATSRPLDDTDAASLADLLSAGVTSPATPTGRRRSPAPARAGSAARPR